MGYTNVAELWRTAWCKCLVSKIWIFNDLMEEEQDLIASSFVYQLEKHLHRFVKKGKRVPWLLVLTRGDYRLTNEGEGKDLKDKYLEVGRPPFEDLPKVDKKNLSEQEKTKIANTQKVWTRLAGARAMLFEQPPPYTIEVSSDFGEYWTLKQRVT